MEKFLIAFLGAVVGAGAVLWFGKDHLAEEIQAHADKKAAAKQDKPLPKIDPKSDPAKLSSGSDGVVDVPPIGGMETAEPVARGWIWSETYQQWVAGPNAYGPNPNPGAPLPDITTDPGMWAGN